MNVTAAHYVTKKLFHNCSWSMICSLKFSNKLKSLHKEGYKLFLRQYSSESNYRKHQNLDHLGIWDNQIELPILLKTSIRLGKPVPKIFLDNCGTQTVIGRRTANEDRICLKELSEDLLYFGVFDGHGGSACSDFCSQSLDHHIKHWLDKGEKNLENVLKYAFLDVNKSFERKVSTETQRNTSGTTCTVCLLRNSVELVVGHVGDSRAMLCRHGKAISLTTDHVPDLETEKARIEKYGGYVENDDSGQCLVNSRLAMSRSIGDLDLKPLGVIAEPETRTIEIKHGKDNFLALTTDGISFVMTDKEACEHISRCGDAHEAAALICDLSLQYASEDNVSVIIVPFGAWGKNKSTAIAIDGIGRYMNQSSRYS